MSNRIQSRKSEELTIEGMMRISTLSADITGFSFEASDVDATSVKIGQYLDSQRGEVILVAHLILGQEFPWCHLTALETIAVRPGIDVNVRKIVVGNSLSRVMQDRVLRDCIWSMIYNALDVNRVEADS